MKYKAIDSNGNTIKYYTDKIAARADKMYNAMNGKTLTIKRV